MLTTPHALIGALIILKTKNLLWGFLLAFISHFIFDFFVPHWNPHLYTEKKTEGKISKKTIKIITLDTLIANLALLALAFFLNLSFKQAVFIWLGALFAILPDLVEAPYYFLDSKNSLLAKYVKFEHNHQLNSSPFWGFLTQIITLIALLISFSKY